MSTIHKAVADYEDWLSRQLGELLQADALARKHHRMRKRKDDFLRATCFRWAATAHMICPELAATPVVLALGDAHVENFGVWRDAEGRLVWGANDFDEAAATPYAFDLLRLVASAILKLDGDGPSASDIARIVRDGYCAGLAAPSPLVLERYHHKLRARAAASPDERRRFWVDLAKLPDAMPPPAFADALRAALPRVHGPVSFKAREAGLGSLGRPRFVALADFQGGTTVREAKIVVPSCWAPNSAPGADVLRLIRGPHRAPDPWLDLQGDIVVRRLAPNSRKIEFSHQPARLGRRLLAVMGMELANIHAADPAAAAAIRADLAGRCGHTWLADAARATAAATERDWRDWRSG